LGAIALHPALGYRQFGRVKEIASNCIHPGIGCKVFSRGTTLWKYFHNVVRFREAIAGRSSVISRWSLVGSSAMPAWNYHWSMNKPEIIIIAALAESNRVIAQNGKLPWTIPEDSQRFESLTLNHTLIMGRKTWENDLKNSPLKNRINIVISSEPEEVEMESQSPEHPNELLVVKSVREALSKASRTEKIFIAGGASIYAQALELADTLELTLVEGNFEGDTFFPEYQYLIGSQFELVAKEVRPGFRYETYKKINR